MSTAPTKPDAEPPMVPELLSVGQVAELLSIGVRTVWRLTSSGELPRPVKIGGATRWRRAELFEWIENL